MKRCKHHVLFPFYSDSTANIGMATTKVLGWRCSACRKYMSLGPASDTIATLVELRAAELATLNRVEAFVGQRLMTDAMNPSEHLGYLAYMGCWNEPGSDTGANNDSERSGWLAAAILDEEAK